LHPETTILACWKGTRWIRTRWRLRCRDRTPCYRLGHAQYEAHDPFLGQYCKQVRSCGERDDAEAAAWRRGATSVTSNISIEPL
jgi:hypothetical protein